MRHCLNTSTITSQHIYEDSQFITASPVRCETRIHQEYKYKFLTHFEMPKHLKRTMNSLLTLCTSALLDHCPFEQQHPAIMQKRITNCRPTHSLLISSQNYLFSLVRRSTNLMTNGRLGKCWKLDFPEMVKKRPIRIRTLNSQKGPARTLQPDGVPWAKMATVIICLQWTYDTGSCRRP